MTSPDGGVPPEFRRIPATWPSRSAARQDPRNGAEETTGGVRFEGDYLNAGRDIHHLQFFLDEAAAELLASARESADEDVFDQDLGDVMPPPELETHLKALEATRLLVIAGGRATGLSTAVIHRGDAFTQRTGLPFRRLTSTNGEELQQDLGRADHAAVLVIDLSRNPELAKSLPILMPRIEKLLEKHDRYLVVAVEERVRLAIAEVAADSVFALKRLQPRLVFRHYFQRSEDEFEAVLGSEKRFRAPLRDAWPPRARRMAEVLNSAEPGLQPEEFHKRLDGGSEERAERLRQLTGQELDPEGRAVLVAAAMLESSPPHVISEAAVALSDRIRGTGWADDPLDGPGVSGRLALIEKVFHPEGRNFTETHLAESVLRVVWQEFPSWRVGLQDWFDLLFTETRFLIEGNLKLVPDRIFELADEIPDASVLLDRIAVLVESPFAEIRDMAGLLLVSGAITSTIGPAVRQRLYDWSRSAPEPIQLAAVAACAHDAYLTRDPGSAFTRLRHLADSPHPEVRAKAEAVIVKSWRFVTPERFLSFLTYCLATKTRTLQHMVPRVFVEVYRDEDLISALQQNPVAFCSDQGGEAREFWRLLLNSCSPDEVARSLDTWTSAAARLSVDDGIAMAELPVLAVPTDYRRLGKLAQASSAPPSPARPRTGRESVLATLILNRLLEIEAHFA